MERIRYNSKSEEFKNPFGAVSDKCEVKFNFHVHTDEKANSVTFVYRQDNSETPIYINMHKTESYDNFDIYSCKLKFEKADLYFYRFEIHTDEGIKYAGLKDGIAVIEDWLPEWQLTVYDSNFKTPEWAKGGIMYQIFPDRFARSEKFTPLPARNPRKIHENWYDIPDFIYGNPDYKANDYFCGNLLGIEEKLDYIKSLGVNIIYLNPIFESPEYHRYSTGNYMNIDPYFGTNEQFKSFTEKCREKGIKVILDGVFSHTGADSIYFNKYGHYDGIGAYNSTESPYFNWYNFINYPHEYESWWGFDNLPNVTETNPEYMQYITGEKGVIEYWQKMGAKGWRLDVADELPDEFLDSLYARAKATDDDCFIIGEVWEDATNKFAYGVRRRYLLGKQMHSVMNYPWRTAILEYVQNGDEKLFNDRLICIMENYPPQVLQCLMNSLSTHDTLRAITYFGVQHDVADEEKGAYRMTAEEYEKGKKMFMQATFLQFTLPGIPSIYYGDEVGLQGFRDPYCRMGYPYGNEDAEILDFYRALAKIRTEDTEDFKQPLKLHAMYNGLYAFKRGDLLCAINIGTEMQYVKFDNKEVLFQYGENKHFDHGVDLMPKSFIILK